MAVSAPSAALDVRSESGRTVLALRGRLDAAGVAEVWTASLEALDRAAGGPVRVDASGLEYCDGSGIALLAELRKRGRGRADIAGLAEPYRPLLDFFPPETIHRPAKPEPRPSLPVELGRATAAVFADFRRQVSFVGELVGVSVRALGRWRDVRWRDAYRTAETSGVDAFPIISLIGFLIGVILAFQSAMPLRQFGAEIFVADLVSVSVVRELGPLMTAILLAGRTGSAFAAELGTMKVSEEVDALKTMGLAPVRFLVLPRVLAGIVVTPILTLYFDLLALVGGALIVCSFGYPLTIYVQHALQVLTFPAFAASLVKAAVFGFTVAAVGCERGLAAGSGAAAVGSCTRRSVVAGVLLAILLDAVFAVMLYALDI
jgi:phospholipid/cholesterol/gamma-HCH transport system permease protein